MRDWGLKDTGREYPLLFGIDWDELEAEEAVEVGESSTMA